MEQSDSPYVLDHRSGHVLWLTLNRPAQRNPLSSDMIEGLHRKLRDADSNEAVRVIVITAKGPVFSSGHDLKEMSGRREGLEPDAEKRVRDVLDACADMMLALVGSPKPIIAAVQGTASAAGCQLVSMCDLALAADTARFCTPGVNIGTFCTTPLVGIGRNMHRKHAMEMALTGDLFSAEDAVRFGLVNRAVPAGQLLEEAEALARRIAAKSAVGIAEGKAAFYAQIEQPIRQAYRDAGCAMLGAMTSAECAEGVDAFLNKRTPHWQGL
jgi:enoyl-CoA hydratase/carnithine racemase